METAQKLNEAPPAIRGFLISDEPSQIVLGLQDNFHLNNNEMGALADLIGAVMIDKSPLTAELAKLDGKITSPKVDVAFLKYSLLKTIFERFPEQYPDVAALKTQLAARARTKNLEQLPGTRSVPTTADIRSVKRTLPPPAAAKGSYPEPVEGPARQPAAQMDGMAQAVPRAVVPPATPVKLRPELAGASKPAEGPPPVKEEKPRLEQFQLRSVDDLINVPPATLAKEPDDEKQLVGRFKQEIQDIANYSGAKRTDIVAGWKKSQIYHTYIEMGNDSIQQGKPISDVMVFRKTSGKPYLSENQFHAISEVSRLLLR